MGWLSKNAIIFATLIVGTGSLAAAPAYHLAVPAAATQPDRQEIPKAADQQTALKLIQSIFKTDYADSSRQGRAAMAKKLLQQGIETTDDPPAKFVLLSQCADAAIVAGQPAILAQSIDALTRSFAVDGVAMKTQGYALIAPACWTPAQAGQLADACGEAVDQAIAADQYDDAVQLQSIGQFSADHSGQVDLSRRFEETRTEVSAVRQEYAQAKSALHRLQTHPNDARACLLAGSFLCFVKDDWSAGLPVLVHGSDPALAAAARADLSPDKDSEAIARAADAWWQIALAQPTLQRQHVQAHAAEYYRQALPELDGLSKTVALKRLNDFDAMRLQRMHLAPGLQAQLFKDENFSQLHSMRIDAQIDFEWGHKPPAPTMPKADFAIRWTGKLRTLLPGLYTLAVQANEGAKLLLDGKPAIENAAGTRRRLIQKINLQLDAGVHDLQLDFWAGSGLAKCKLFWIPPGSLALVPIPPEAFYHGQDEINP